MTLKIFVFFVLLHAVFGEEVSKKRITPQWSKIYTVEVQKMYLTSGYDEQLQFWRSKLSSRLDKNNGANIYIARALSRCTGYSYKIHPETTDDNLNEMVCYRRNCTEDKPIVPIDLLPDVTDYELVGIEDVRGIKCAKYEDNYDNDNETLSYRNTIWAYVDKTKRAWVPVRYEEETLNYVHGYIEEHVIWDFYNFDTRFKSTVLNVVEDPENCREDTEDEDEDNKLSVHHLDTTNIKFLNPKDEQHFNHVFTSYQHQYGRRYNDEKEHAMRKRIFYKNWRMIVKNNRINSDYRLELNKFSDRTKKEKKMYKGSILPKTIRRGTKPYPYSVEEVKKMAESLPLQYDARLDGLVGPVLNQDECGCCWSFAAAASLEGALAKSNGGTLIKLSNQALIDCSWEEGNLGCNGGFSMDAFKWTIKHGIPTEEEYGPYDLSENYCRMENVTHTYKVKDWTSLESDVDQIKHALVNYGPISVAVATPDKFHAYSGGILNDPHCGNETDHEVALVGYGEKDGETFWILKNSWGPEWGLDGFMHISANNTCAVNSSPSFPIF